MDRPSRITLVGVSSGARKIEAIKEVRRVANWTLRPAKETVDAVLAGERRRVPLVTDRNADSVAQRFATLGFVVEVDGRRISPPDDRPTVPSGLASQRGAVEVRAVHDPTASGRLLIEGRLLSGDVAAGDRLGLPVTSSLVLTRTIARLDRARDAVVIEIGEDAEDAELWAMLIEGGEVLSVLPPDSA